MHNLTKLCLRKPISTIILIMALVIFGLTAIPKMNMQLTPDMELPMMIVYTLYPQAGPEEVERLVSNKIENIGGTIAGLDSVMSQSMENMSYMIFSFDYGTDMDEAYMDLQEELQTIKNDLPEKASTPVVIIMDINATDAMDLSIASKDGSNVLNYVNDTLKPEIDKITNVASTTVWGGNEAYISVNLIAEKLEQYNLNMSSIANFLTAANFSMPAGSVDVGSQTFNVSAEVDYSRITDIQNIPITTGSGEVIHLSDVANVSFASKEADSLSRYNGYENVTLGIVKQQGTNAVELSKDVKKVINDLNEKYPDMEVTTTYDSSTAIISSLKSVAETLVLGIIITMFVLFLFFGDLKASLIVGSSMPISLLATTILMNACGYSLNIVTMGALVIGIGMMVDNSIVVVEMCFRKKAQGMSYEEASYSGVKTVALSITASTLTTVVVYFPLALLKGLSGQMFGQLGFTIIFSLTSSLIAAMSLVPLCFSKYQPKEKTDTIVSRFLDKVSNWYGNLLSKALNRKKLLSVLALVIFIISMFCFKFVHFELMPATDEGQITVAGEVRPGLSLENKDAVIKKLEQFVSEDIDVKNYSASTEAGSSSITVKAYLKKERSRSTEDIVNEWNKEMQQFKNVEIVCSSTSSSMMSTGGGTGKEVDIQGSNYEDLKVAIKQLDEQIRKIDGVISTTSSFSNSGSKAEVIIDPIKAVAAGTTPAQAAQSLYMIKTGKDAMDVSIEDKDYKVTVEYPSESYKTVQDILNLSIPNNYGKSIILSDIAEIKYTDTPEMIERQDSLYKASITANYDTEKKYEVEDAIKTLMEEVSLPRGVKQMSNMEDEMMMEEFKAILIATATGLWLVFMVMAMQFESIRYAGMIMFCVPFSLIGSVLMLLVTQSTLSMTSMMGFLMLGGIVVNNGILYVDTTNQLRQSMPTEEALIEAGKSRLRPILMTTLTTILSMVPLGLGIGENGEVMQGMAAVIIGGLVASTILTLILLPIFYMIIHKHSKAKKLKKKRKLEMAAIGLENAIETGMTDDSGTE
ncbi:MAG: efflux RND transporter permease subunit [Lachnospiraceae bacterium]|nr:efflux RND transporter permease subunit [Lachnospiraceae bacterium]